MSLGQFSLLAVVAIVATLGVGTGRCADSPAGTVQADPPSPQILATGGGNANKTFAPILMADMFVYADGSMPLSAMPDADLDVERPIQTDAQGNLLTDPANPLQYLWDRTWQASLNNLPTHPRYVNNDDFEGALRYDQTKGPHKFGRIKTGSFADTLIFSGHKNDLRYGTSRGRAEMGWISDDLSIPNGVEFWFAMHSYFAVPEPQATAGQLVVFQLFPNPYTAGLYPMVTLTLDTTADVLRMNLRYCTESPSLQGVNIEEVDPAFPEQYTGIVNQWNDIVFKGRLGWDVNQHDPYLQVYINDTQILDYTGLVGYRGPGQNGIAVSTAIKFGLYP
ncbi:hypothetical protein HQ520_09020, partial [bacterium]|nr:hypothetical protein [bacterium]